MYLHVAGWAVVPEGASILISPSLYRWCYRQINPLALVVGVVKKKQKKKNKLIALKRPPHADIKLWIYRRGEAVVGTTD